MYTVRAWDDEHHLRQDRTFAQKFLADDFYHTCHLIWPNTQIITNPWG